MNKRVLAVIVIVILVFSIVSLSACSAQRRPGPVEPSPGTDRMQPQDSTVKADRIAQKIAEREDINSATVVLANGQAWVGIDMAANAGDQVTDEIKNEVTNIVKTEDKTITTVFVTADADTVTRLRNIARDIGAGKPVSGFMDELNEIGRRITPSVR